MALNNKNLISSSSVGQKSEKNLSGIRSKKKKKKKRMQMNLFAEQTNLQTLKNLCYQRGQVKGWWRDEMGVWDWHIPTGIQKNWPTGTFV